MFFKIKNSKLLLYFFSFLFAFFIFTNNSTASSLIRFENKAAKAFSVNHFFFLKVSDDKETQKITEQLKRLEIPEFLNIFCRAYNYNANTVWTLELRNGDITETTRKSVSSAITDERMFNAGGEFSEFITGYSKKYPAENLVITIYDRAKFINNNSFCILDQSIDLKKFASILEKIKSDTGRKINALQLDIDNVQCLELAYEIKESVDFIIASEEKIPQAGVPYFEILSGVLKNNDLDMRKFCFQFVSCWHKYFKDNLPFGEKATLSAFKTVETAMITEKLNIFLEDLISDMKNPEYSKIISAIIISKVRRYTDSKDMIDIFDLGRLVNEEVFEERVEQSSREFLASITNSILKNSAFGDYGRIPGSYNSFGVASYMPLPAASVNNYRQLNFANETLWKNFLEAYYSLTLQKN